MDKEMGSVLAKAFEWLTLGLVVITFILAMAGLNVIGGIGVLMALGAGITSLMLTTWSIEPSQQTVPVPATVLPAKPDASPARSRSVARDDDDFWGESNEDDDFGFTHGPTCICLSCSQIWSSTDDPFSANFVCGMDYSQAIFNDDSICSNDDYTWASDD